MTTARAAAPNLGGRANTRSRAVVANFGTSNAETDPLDSAVRLLAVGVSANCARASAQSAQAKAAHLEPGTSTPSGLIRNWHSGLDATLCDTANYYALPAPAGSAQPIAHHGVLPVDSQPLAFTSAYRHVGALCLTRGFLYAPVPSVCRVCQSAKNPLDLGPVDSGCGPVPKRGANFNAPPRTTTLATGNYGNGWRFFYCGSRRAFRGPLPALAGLSFYGVAERIERIANRSVRQTVVARKAAA